MSPSIPPGPRPPRRWRKKLLFLTAAAALALLLWSRPEMASEHFMEGHYAPMNMVPTKPGTPIRGGRATRSLVHLTSRQIAPLDGNAMWLVRPQNYQLDGHTVWMKRHSDTTPQPWHYRSFDGVAILLTPEALAIFEKNGRPLSEREDDLGRWWYHVLRHDVLVRYEPRRSSCWPRLIREHPRFAAALPPELRAKGEIPWTLYLRYRWHDFLVDYPKLRDRLPQQLRAY
jgi:hypothetical protein